MIRNEGHTTHLKKNIVLRGRTCVFVIIFIGGCILGESIIFICHENLRRALTFCGLSRGDRRLACHCCISLLKGDYIVVDSDCNVKRAQLLKGQTYIHLSLLSSFRKGAELLLFWALKAVREGCLVSMSIDVVSIEGYAWKLPFEATINTSIVYSTFEYCKRTSSIIQLTLA